MPSSQLCSWTAGGASNIKWRAVSCPQDRPDAALDQRLSEHVLAMHSGASLIWHHLGSGYKDTDFARRVHSQTPGRLLNLLHACMRTQASRTAR
jgi:hypothetical protein